MFKVLIFTLLTLQYAFCDLDSDVKHLKCLICQATIDELNHVIEKIDPDIKVDVGNYRLDSDGNIQQKSVSQSRSETHLSEILDDICKKMEDYVRARNKSNGELIVMKLVLPNGKMNPESSNVDFVQDDDLNKSLQYYCEGLLEEYEDNIIKHYINNSDNIHKRVCLEEAKLCTKNSILNFDRTHNEL